MDQTTPVNWVLAVEQTALEAVIDNLATAVEADTNTRNGLADIATAQGFTLKREPNEPYFAVFRDIPATRLPYPQMWPVRLVRVFVLPGKAPGKPASLIVQEELFDKSQTEVVVEVGLDDGGEALFRVDEQWLKGWQFRMRTLQRLFFGRDVLLVRG